MGPVFYVMAILGCGDGQAACEQVGLVDAHYATATACNDASAQALLEHSDVAFPVVMTECRPAPRNIVASAKAAPRG